MSPTHFRIGQGGTPCRQLRGEALIEEPNLSAAEQSLGNGVPDLILVDDDPLITDSLAFVLQDEYRVHVCDTRQAAKSLLQRR